MHQMYDWLLWGMAITAVIVFIALYKVEAGYGMLLTKKWGPTLPNRLGWILMEAPVFVVMTVLWAMSDRTWELTPLVFFIVFQSHYFQRSFIFPFLLRGKSRMPLSIMFMGVMFNTLNALMQGGWIFYFAPSDLYTPQWLMTPQFIIGATIFFTGMYVNIQSDKIIRNLRKPGDTGHYIPRGGMFRYVSSANYFGEFTEWVGFAIMTWSVPGAIFALWTFANLTPRAAALHKAYELRFSEEFTELKRKKIIPFIY